VVSLLADAVVITGRIEAGRILCSRRRRAGIRHLISIGARTDPPPAGYRNVTHRLQLIFEDELTAELGGPTPDDVERLIDFARRVDLSSGRLLVQCQAGISRSAAAAAIVLRVVLRSDSEAGLLTTFGGYARGRGRTRRCYDSLMNSSEPAALCRIAGEPAVNAVVTTFQRSYARQKTVLATDCRADSQPAPGGV
jgi:hypothetical protein